MEKIFRKHIDELFRDVTAIGGFAASLLIILLFFSSPLLLPLVAGSVLTAAMVILIRMFYFKDRPKKEAHHNFLERIDASSFPSLHAARIVYLAILFSAHFANAYLTILFATTAALVSFSRIYLKKHDWVDVLGGIGLGTATYYIIAVIF